MTISFLARSRCAISLRWPKKSELLSKNSFKPESLRSGVQVWRPFSVHPPADAVGGALLTIPGALGQAGYPKPRLRGSSKPERESIPPQAYAAGVGPAGPKLVRSVNGGFFRDSAAAIDSFTLLLMNPGC